MSKYIKAQSKDSFLIWSICIFGAFLFGVGIHAIAMLDAEETYFPLGTFMSVTAVLCVVMFGRLRTFPAEFSLAVSMGRRRSETLIDSYIVALPESIAGCVIVMALLKLELWLYPIIYSSHEPDESISATFGADNILIFVAIILAVIVVVNIIGHFFAALRMKYGPRVLIILWFLWIISFIILPLVFDEEVVPMLGNAGKWVVSFFANIPIWALISAGVAILGAMVYATVRMVMRQNVTL